MKYQYHKCLLVEFIQELEFFTWVLPTLAFSYLIKQTCHKVWVGLIKLEQKAVSADDDSWLWSH